ncbi:MAG: 3-oxoacyl-ACP synthase, partial [Bacteroidales bacterium]|nr:3-oxoacyl-ACP synthase [Bacteroidales bacterium]
MKKLNAVITGIAAYVPSDILTNDDIAKLVDTSDEWITSRVGIKERRILKGEGKGVSYMGTKAVANLLAKTKTKPEEVDVVIFATTTPDH